MISTCKIGMGPAYNLQANTEKELLLKALRIVYRQVNVPLSSLEPAGLGQSTEVQHPVAGSKREVLSCVRIIKGRLLV